MSAINTTIVHPSHLYTAGIRLVLSQSRFRVEQSVEAPEKLPIECNTPANLFIVGAIDGEVLCRNVAILRERFPTTPIVVVGCGFSMSAVLELIRFGATSVLEEQSAQEQLLRALELTLIDFAVLPISFVHQFADGKNKNGEAVEHVDMKHTQLQTCLSGRELSVLHTLVDGATNKEIARELSVTEATVKVHVKAVLRKLGLKNRTQAAIWAANNLPSGEQVSHLVNGELV